MSQLFHPSFPLTVIEISDSALRLAGFKKGRLQTTAVFLEPGILRLGRILNRSRFSRHLAELRRELGGSGTKIPVHVVAPAVIFHFQIVCLPASEKFNPRLDHQKELMDWYELPSRHTDHRREIVTIRVEKELLENYQKILEKAGFWAVSLEPTVTAVANWINQTHVPFRSGDSWLSLRIFDDGIESALIIGGKVYDSNFRKWPPPSEEKSRIAAVLYEEIKREQSLVERHHLSRLGGLILITNELRLEIRESLKNNFGIPVIVLMPHLLKSISQTFFGTVGGLLRSRNHLEWEDGVNLWRSKKDEFLFPAEISGWLKRTRVFSLALLGAIAAILLLVDGVLAGLEYYQKFQVQNLQIDERGREAAQLWKEIKEFNQLTEKAVVATGASRPIANLLSEINSLSLRKAAITKIQLDFLRGRGTVFGESAGEVAAVGFKDALVKAGFQNVSLPLSNLKKQKDDTVSFVITFSL